MVGKFILLTVLIRSIRWNTDKVIIMDKHIEILVQRYPQLDSCKNEILKAYQVLEEAYSAGRKLLVAGNGGSASDSEHIVGELMK